MSDVLQHVLTRLGAVDQVLIRLGAVDEKLKNIQERGEEDRKDSGRHRQYQREQLNEMRDEIRTTNDQVTRIVPIVEDLQKKDQRKKVARDLLRGTGRWAIYAASSFAAWVVWFLGLFEKFGGAIGKVFASLH